MSAYALRSGRHPWKYGIAFDEITLPAAANVLITNLKISNRHYSTTYEY